MTFVTYLMPMIQMTVLRNLLVVLTVKEFNIMVADMKKGPTVISVNVSSVLMVFHMWALLYKYNICYGALSWNVDYTLWFLNQWSLWPSLQTLTLVCARHKKEKICWSSLWSEAGTCSCFSINLIVFVKNGKYQNAKEDAFCRGPAVDWWLLISKQCFETSLFRIL